MRKSDRKQFVATTSKQLACTKEFVLSGPPIIRAAPFFHTFHIDSGFPVNNIIQPSGRMGSSNVAVWNACVRERLFDAADTAERCRNGSNGESLRNSAGNTGTAYSNACAGIVPRNCLSSAGSKPYQHWRWICNQPKHYRQRSEQPYQSSNDPSGCAVFSKKT